MSDRTDHPHELVDRDHATTVEHTDCRTVLQAKADAVDAVQAATANLNDARRATRARVVPAVALVLVIGLHRLAPTLRCPAFSSAGTLA